MRVGVFEAGRVLVEGVFIDAGDAKLPPALHRGVNIVEKIGQRARAAEAPDAFLAQRHAPLADEFDAARVKHAAHGIDGRLVRRDPPGLPVRDRVARDLRQLGEFHHGQIEQVTSCL